MNRTRPETTSYDRTLSIYNAYAEASPDQPGSDQLEDVRAIPPSRMQGDLEPEPRGPRYQLHDDGASYDHHSGYSEQDLIPSASRYGDVAMNRFDYTHPSPAPSLPASRTTSHASPSTATFPYAQPLLPPHSQRAPPSSYLTYPASQLHSLGPSTPRNEKACDLSVESSRSGTSKWDSHGEALNGGHKKKEEDDAALGTLTYGGGLGLGSHDQRRVAAPAMVTGWRKFFPPSLPIRLFILLVIIETVVNLSIQVDLLVRFNAAESRTGTSALNTETSRTMPVYLCIFGLAHLFQLVLAFDAIINRNTIQIIGLSVFNALFLAYAVIQMSEIRATLGRTADGQVTTGETSNSILHVPVTVLTGGILGMIALAEVGYVILSWFVYKEFGWETYKLLGASIAIHRIHRQYQIFICMVRFSAFFFAGFGIQLIFLVLQKTDAEFYVTIAMLPVSILLLLEGTLAARFEWLWGMICFMFGLLAGCGYFAFKLFRIYQQKDTTYGDVFKSLAVFAALCLLMLMITFIWSIIVTHNFNQGLKQQLARAYQRRRAQRKDSGGAASIKAERWTDNKSAKNDEFQMEMTASRMSID